uniref:Uncharacterized protein n=2 Tax=Amphimedon queenslandica TaxID=400682 RepID=A0A1X7T344_AMPQE
ENLGQSFRIETQTAFTQTGERTSVQEHIKFITEVFSKLSVTGDNNSDKDHVVYLFASLPEHFDKLVTAFKAISDVSNLETVTEKLRQEERKQTKQKAVKETEEGLTAKHEVERAPKCHYCKIFGHIQRFSNSATTKKPAGDTDSDEAGLLVEHAIPLQQTLKSQNKWIVDSGPCKNSQQDLVNFLTRS